MTKEELLKAIDELASRVYIKNFSDEELDSKLMEAYSGSTDWQCQQAVIFADRLINELKKQN